MEIFPKSHGSAEERERRSCLRGHQESVGEKVISELLFETWIGKGSPDRRTTAQGLECPVARV